jgi:hypothetical protein
MGKLLVEKIYVTENSFVWLFAPACVMTGMALIAKIALGVIIGGVVLALLVTGFFVWNRRQRNERLAVGLSPKLLL